MLHVPRCHRRRGRASELLPGSRLTRIILSGFSKVYLTVDSSKFGAIAQLSAAQFKQVDYQGTHAESDLALAEVLECSDVPMAVHCDRKNAFVLDREPTVGEQLQGITPKSTFELACEKLGIEEIDAANEFLRESFLDTLNTKFAKPPIDPEDAHVQLLAGRRLKNILCFEERRVVAEDYVVQFERSLLQIRRQKRLRLPAPGTQVIVRKWLDRSVHVFAKEDTELLVEELEVRPKKNKQQALSA